MRALLASFEDHRGDYLGAIPRAFELSNPALADLINVLHDLSADELVDEAYVKNEKSKFKRQFAAN